MRDPRTSASRRTIRPTLPQPGRALSDFPIPSQAPSNNLQKICPDVREGGQEEKAEELGMHAEYKP